MKISFSTSFKENPGFPFPLVCPKCEHEQTKPLGELRKKPEFTCANCGTVVTVNLDQLDAVFDGFKNL